MVRNRQSRRNIWPQQQELPPPSEEGKLVQLDSLTPVRNDHSLVDCLTALCPDGEPPEDTQQDDAAMPLDRLALARIHNATKSRLCQLPDELIVHIMTYLPWHNLYCLRHTSRIFLRLFESREFRAFHDKANLISPGYQLSWKTQIVDRFRDRIHPSPGNELPWNLEMMDNLTDEYKALMLHIFNDMYCDHCRSLGPERGSYCAPYWSNWAKCKGCNSGHQAHYFTATRPETPSDVSRWSNWLRWSDWQKWTGWQRWSYWLVRNGADLLISSYQLSRSQCNAQRGHIRLCAHTTTTIPAVVNSILKNGTGIVAACQHPSHIPSHHAPGSASLDSASSDSVFPSITVHNVMVGRMDCRKVAVWSYTAHVDLSAHGDSPLTAQEFRDHIDRLHQDQNPAQFIAPASYQGTWMELRCVDPARCCCLRYPGMRAGTERCRTHETSRVLLRREMGPDTLNVQLVPCSHNGKRCLKIIYSRFIHFCELDYDLYNPMDLFSEVPPRLPNTSAISGNISRGWFDALDPDSYHLTEDEETRGLVWCSNANCRRYHKYLDSSGPYTRDPSWWNLSPGSAPVYDLFKVYNWLRIMSRP